MDKNTIWAIVLSTLVIVGSYFLLPVIFGNKKNAQSQTTTVEVSADTQAEAVQQAAVTDSLFTDEEEQLIAQVEETEEEPEEAAVEKEITINTGFAEVVFTTKGGDIISYKLVGHNDKETNDFVQLSDNVTEANRTCAIAIGGAENQILNEVFTYEQPDPYTILFKKNLSIKGQDGRSHSYTLGKNILSNQMNICSSWIF